MTAVPYPRREPVWADRPVRARRCVQTLVRQFRRRLRDRRFWVVQALVIAIAVANTLLEATSHLGVLPDLALLPVSTYFIPVVYAALNFGVEGAVPTALWVSLLTVPNLILWHTGAERPGVILQLALVVAIAAVIARRVEFEMSAKERAEAANACLERLNRTAAASARSLDLESVLAETLEAMLDPGARQTSWIVLDGETGGERLLTASTSNGPEVGPIGEHRAPDERRAVVPLRVSGRLAGAVGLADAVDALCEDDVKLLEAVGNQLGVALGNIRYFRQTELMVDQLSRAQRALEEYVRLATDAQEEERKRLARELHDDTIQTLVIAKAELNALTSEQPVPSALVSRLETVEAALADAIDNVRRFSRDLRPSLLDDLGLVHAIDWLVSDLGARTGIDTRLRTNGTPRRLDQRDELALFRIVQEALHNVERHAEATSVRVRLHFGLDVRATVVDNGLGFDAGEVLDDGSTPKRLGLLGMRERAKLAGAALSIRSRPACGTRVTVALRSPAGAA